MMNKPRHPEPPPRDFHLPSHPPPLPPPPPPPPSTRLPAQKARLRGPKSIVNQMGQLFDHWRAILGIQKFRRIVSYTGFYCFVSLLAYAYTNNTTRAGISRADQFYASYPAGTELLTDSAKLYKAALANCFEEEEWGPIEFSIMAKHFERQGKPPYAYHSQYMAHLLSNGQLDGSG